MMDNEHIQRISKALADRTRLRVYREISTRHGVTCGELVSLRGVTPATISHHLKILYDAGLIECRKEGQFVHSLAVRKTMEQYAAALVEMAGGRPPQKPRGRPAATSNGVRTTRGRG